MKKILILLFSIFIISNVNALELSCPNNTYAYNEYFNCNLIDNKNNNYEKLSGTLEFSNNLDCVISEMNSSLTALSKDKYKFDINGKSSNKILFTISCNVKSNIKSNTELVYINDLTYKIDGKDYSEIVKSDYVKITDKIVNVDNLPRNTDDKNTLLNNLTIDIAPESFIFSRFVTKYSFEVLNEISDVKIDYQPLNSEAYVTMNGNSKLNVGLNNYDICITSPYSDNKTCYSIYITRLREGDTLYNPDNDASVSTIKIVNKDFKFNPDEHDYTVKLNDNEDSLKLTVVPNNKDAIVNISNYHNLKNKDTITITTTSKNGTNKIEYYIHISKNNKENNILYIELIAGGVVILVLFIIIFIMNSKKKKNIKIKDELDELL